MTAARGVRRALRRLVETPAGLALLHRTSPDLVAIFTWHSVGSESAPFFDPAGEASGASSHCALSAFEAHIRWIRDRFRIVTLAEATERLQSGRPGFGWVAALTFDDGFRNAAEEAVPWLDARGLPCTFFINAALASGHWVKDVDIEMLALRTLGPDARPPLGNGGVDTLLRQLGRSREAVARDTRAYANWDRLRSLPPSVAFGNHGERHVRLSAVSDEDARQEIDAGREALDRELGVGRLPYAFAFGQPADITVGARAHALATHTAVFSAYGGFSWNGDRLDDVPRVPVFSSPGPELLAEYTFPPRFVANRILANLRRPPG